MNQGPFQPPFSNAISSPDPDHQTPGSTVFNPAIQNSYEPILHSHPPKTHLEQEPYGPPSRKLQYDYPYRKERTRGRGKQLSGKLDRRPLGGKHALKERMRTRGTKSKKNSYKQGNVSGTRRVNFTGVRGLKKKTITNLKTCSMKNTISKFKFEIAALGPRQALKALADKNPRERSINAIYQARPGMRRNHTAKMLRPYESFRALDPNFHQHNLGRFNSRGLTISNLF